MAGDERRTYDRTFEFRAEGDAGDGLTLEGYAAVFGQRTEISDWWDGDYEEEIASGAFAKTLRERGDRVVLQFDHGRHPVVGSIPIGQFDDLREDRHGLYVRARLHDNWLVEPVRDAIASQAIKGMSFRFQIMGSKDERDDRGQLLKRTITEVKLHEVGPVVFPAYEGTEVGVRSWARAMPQELRVALAAPDAMTAGMLTGEQGTEPPAGSTTGRGEAAEEAGPAIQVTRQERRLWAARLRGVPHAPTGAPDRSAA